MRRTGATAWDMLGAIPAMLSADNPAGAVEQIDAFYCKAGGGWRDSDGWTLSANGGRLTSCGDPARWLIAQAKLRDEQVLFFDGAWVAVVQPDGAFRVARID